MALRLNRSLEIQSQPLDQSPAELIWNMAFVLDSVFTQSADRDRDFGEGGLEVEVLEIVEGMLESRDEIDVEGVLGLRRVLEDAERERRR